MRSGPESNAMASAVTPVAIDRDRTSDRPDGCESEQRHSTYFDNHRPPLKREAVPLASGLKNATLRTKQRVLIRTGQHGFSPT